MTSKFLRVFLAGAVTLTISASAQTGSASAPSGAAATAPTPAASAPVAATGPTKVGTINIEGAIFGCNEGQREEEGLKKKFEPKQAELKNQNDELEGLKKQLTNTQDKLNPDALETLKKQIESKQKLFDRAYQDFQEEVNNQNQEIATKVLQKMAPMIVKYSQENGFGIIVDTSKIWPQSNVLWWAEGIDITKAVVDAYNVQSGVPAPTGAAKPPAPKPATGTGAAKPAAPAAPKQ